MLRSKYDHETDELPATQGQPNTRQNYCRLKVAFWVTFFCPTANNFSWVGLDFISVTDYRKPNPTQILRKHHNKKKNKLAFARNDAYTCLFLTELQAEWRSGPAHLRAEKDVFWLMLALMSRLSGVGSGLGMRELWLPGVPQLKASRRDLLRAGGILD